MSKMYPLLIPLVSVLWTGSGLLSMAMGNQIEALACFVLASLARIEGRLHPDDER